MTNKRLNYEKGDPKLLAAWIAYKKNVKYREIRSLMDFVAGWNAANAEMKKKKRDTQTGGTPNAEKLDSLHTPLNDW